MWGRSLAGQSEAPEASHSAAGRCALADAHLPMCTLRAQSLPELSEGVGSRMVFLKCSIVMPRCCWMNVRCSEIAG